MDNLIAGSEMDFSIVCSARHSMEQGAYLWRKNKIHMLSGNRRHWNRDQVAERLVGQDKTPAAVEGKDGIWNGIKNLGKKSGFHFRFHLPAY
jgi:hypothetical protein